VLDTLTEGFTKIAKAHDTGPWLHKDESCVATIPHTSAPANHEWCNAKRAGRVGSLSASA
jgi:hypothetical protein